MSNALDISSLRAIASISEAQNQNKRVQRTWLIKNLLELITTDPDDVIDKASVLLSAVLNSEQRTLNAMDAKVEDVINLFDLKQIHTPMSLPTMPHKPPRLLNLNLENLQKAFYNAHTEASCHIAVDYMIAAANLKISELHPQPSRPRKRLKMLHGSTNSTSSPPLLPVQVFLELEMHVTVSDSESNQVHVTGSADWVLGYRTSADAFDGTVLVVVEGKRRDQFGAGEAQLLTYLAILRQLRIDTGRQDCIVQGCYTDGERYAFMCIDNDGLVALSNVYDIRGDEQRNVVFNYIVAVLETAVRTSPTTSPVKPVKQSEDVATGGKSVYSKIYNIADGLEILDEANDIEGILQEIE